MKIRRWHLLLVTGIAGVASFIVSYKLSKAHPSTQGLYPVSVTKYARSIITSSVEVDEKMSLPFGGVEEVKIRARASDVLITFTERILPAGVEPTARIRLIGRFFREPDQLGRPSKFMNAHRNGPSYAIGVLEPRTEKSRDFEGLAAFSVELPTTFKGKLSVETVSGDIEASLPEDAFKQYERGELSFSSSSGKIKVQKRN